MIKNYVCALAQQARNLYQENSLLFISSIFIPLIVPLFFYGPTSLLRALFYVSIPFLLTLLYKNRQEVKQLISQDKIIWRIIAVFLVFMSASVLWSDNGEKIRYFSKGKLFLILGLTTLSTFYITYKYPKFSNVIKNCFIFGAVSSAIILLLPDLKTYDLEWGQQRLEGMGRAANPVQASLLYGLAIIAIIFGSFSNQYSRTKIYLIKALLVLPPLEVMLMTQSRGPFLSLIVTFAILFILSFKSRIKAALFLCIGMGILAVPSYIALKHTDILDRKTSGRFEIWNTAIDQIEEKPIFGNGLAVTNRYTFKAEDGTTQPASHIHSLYLSTLFQGGIVGLVLLLSLYFLLAKRYLELTANQAADYMWIGGWVVMGAAFGLTDFGGIIMNLSTEWLVFWWPIGLVLGHVAYNRQRAAQAVTPQ